MNQILFIQQYSITFSGPSMFSEAKESSLQPFVGVLDSVLCGLSIWTPNNVPIMMVSVLNLWGHLAGAHDENSIFSPQLSFWLLRLWSWLRIR